MPRIAGLALRTPAGDLAATIQALCDDRPGPLGSPRRLPDDAVAAAAAAASEATAGGRPDLLLFACTKGDLDGWMASVHAGAAHPPGGLSGSPGAVARRLAAPFGCPALAVSAACASATAAIGVAARAMRAGRATRVLIVACDAITPFISEGFAALRALDPAGAHPYDAARAGLSLGEVAGAILLAADGDGPTVIGWGGSLDANHLTGPTRDGSGLAAACRRAWQVAGIDRVDVAVGHGTGTRYNDDSESLAYAALQSGMPVTGLKGGLGHSLGACGIAELAVAAWGLSQGWLPGTAGLRQAGTVGGIAPLPPGRHDLRPGRVMCANAGFGGINHAVVLATSDAAAAPPVPTCRTVRRLQLADGDFQTITAQQILGRIDTGWGRMDAASRALTALAMQADLPEDAAIVLLTDAGCAASDRAFDLHRSQPGGDPQRFPYTLPTTPIGEASIRRRLRGPGLCLAGASDDEGRTISEELLQDCPAVLLARVEADQVPHKAWAEVLQRG
jgi:hypothetical protein